LSESARGRARAASSVLPDAPSFDDVIDEVRRVLAGIRHGSVTLIVQDGRIVQIDATQKLRVTARRAGQPP
jgi:hypothetical protein